MFTPFGRWLVRLSIPWLLIFALAMDAVLTWIGIPGGERPIAGRIALVAIAVAPVALYIFSPMLVRLPGFDWLFLRPQPVAVVDGSGLDLRLPRLGPQRFEWDRIGSLKFKSSWNGGSELRSPEGDLLATLPDELVHPKMHWTTGYTLAESVVQARPDRYALATDRASLGRPASFDLRDRVSPSIDLAAWKRGRNAMLTVILVGLVMLGAIGAFLLFNAAGT